jgi:hypothetical protein
MKVLCPKCRREIGNADVNVPANVAWCRGCQEAFSVAKAVRATGTPDETAAGLVTSVDELALKEPPKGAWFENNFDGFVVGATTRHPVAFFLVPFMCVWSGFSLGGIYGTQIVQGQFNLVMSLFGLPFLAGTLLFGSIALMAVCGKVTVTVCGGEGTIFTGVGPLGWRQRFDARAVRRVYEERGSGEDSGSKIVLEGAKRVSFGCGLNDARRHFMCQVLRAVLAAPGEILTG